MLDFNSKMSNLSDDLVLQLQKHLGLELDAFYFYWSASTQFRGIYTSYPGFAKYFQAESTEELKHAQKFVDFLIKRGHNVVFPVIPSSKENEDYPHEVLSKSLIKENEVLRNLEFLNYLGKKDADLSSFLEEMIKEQQTAISELIRMINEVETLISDGQIKHGLYLYDQKLQK